MVSGVQYLGGGINSVVIYELRYSGSTLITYEQVLESFAINGTMYQPANNHFFWQVSKIHHDSWGILYYIILYIIIYVYIYICVYIRIDILSTNT
jgi:hypothetical protein